MRNTGATIACALIAFALINWPALAATVMQTAGNELCKISYSGEVEAGDLDRFKAVALEVFPEDIGESTARNTVCLDSPGGSYVEGIDLAEYFYETGVGTVIAEAAECYSSCALMFMMGRANGPEVSFINRKLHIRGLLGFHRPTIDLPDTTDTFKAEDIEYSYDLAVSSVVRFVALANRTAPWSSQPMVPSDLLEQIFSTRGEEIYLIDTIEKAARWDIELLGVRYPARIDEERAYYACENTLQWQVGLQEQPLEFVRLLDYDSYSRLVSDAADGRLFDVWSRKTGYASAGCLVRYSDGSLRLCAEDQYTGTRVGRGDCAVGGQYEMRWANPLSIWRPETPIARANDEWAADVEEARCVVRSGARIADDERCLVTVSLEYPPTSKETIAHTFLWPSGNRTVLRRTKGGTSRINDAPADRQYGDYDFDGCYLNLRTQNEFCYDFPDRPGTSGEGE